MAYSFQSWVSIHDFPIFSSPCAVECLDKNVIRFEGSKFVDSGGGFLIEEKTGQIESQVRED